MTKLGDSVAAMRRLRARGTEPAGDTLLVETPVFGANPGGLRMLSYAPAGLRARAPLVVALHGCLQTAEAHACNAGWTTLAERFGFALLTPEQRAANNINRCFNWFKPEDAAREAASIEDMIAALMDTHALDGQRVYVAGLSAGGAMASVLLATRPERFAAGAIVAGLPYGIADSPHSAWGAMRGQRQDAVDLAAAVRRASPAATTLPRITIWHGDADATVHAANADAIAQQWVGAHGLDIAAHETETTGRLTRRVWRARRTGDVLVESNLVEGLGHGVPLSTLGEDGVGAVAPHMLEAGVSAAREIVRFWGLMDTTAPVRSPRALKPLLPKPRPKPRPSSLGKAMLATLSNTLPVAGDALSARSQKGAGLKP